MEPKSIYATTPRSILPQTSLMLNRPGRSGCSRQPENSRSILRSLFSQDGVGLNECEWAVEHRCKEGG